MQEQKRNCLAKGRVGCNGARMGGNRSPRIVGRRVHEIQDVEELCDAGATSEILGSESYDEVAGFGEGGSKLWSGVVRVPDVAEKPVTHRSLESRYKPPRRVVG